ncbi:Xaa-Pro peptidase family protein [Candidatus Aminicenantes bacterium AH-873-B07]|jgi:Xaa-Pro dipeptidase|nr:Xaa-Pro peptidase family protein [Candidatus Aminicenantes bacterium AH-873-B07]
MLTRRKFFKIGGLSITIFGFINNIFSNPENLVQTKLKKLTSGIKPLTPEDFEKRLNKAQRLMAKYKIDGLFLTGGTDLLFFTNVNWGRSERTFGAILNRKSEPIWICPAFERERAAERIPKSQEIRTWEEYESPFKLIANIMKDLGARSGRLALGPTVRSFVLFGLKKDAPGLELVNGAIITEKCRAIKTPKEIEYMELANKITKLAYKEALKQLYEGMAPSELSDIIRNAHQCMGVKGGGWPQFGPNTAFPHGSSILRYLHKGDVVMIDGGCSVEGFRSDVTRTIVFGKPSKKQIKIWNIVKKAQSEALKAVQPGVPCEYIDQVARKVIEEAGYGPSYKYFTHRLGHGIGMDGHEYPYLVQGNKLKLQPGMTFSNEPGIYIYGEFGIRIEDCFVVTENGGRFLGGMESIAIDKPFSE